MPAPDCTPCVYIGGPLDGKVLDTHKDAFPFVSIPVCENGETVRQIYQHRVAPVRDGVADFFVADGKNAADAELTRRGELLAQTLTPFWRPNA